MRPVFLYPSNSPHFWLHLGLLSPPSSAPLSLRGKKKKGWKVDFGHTVGGKQDALVKTQMGTLDVAPHFLDRHLSVGHSISQTLMSSSIKRENGWEVQKEYPLCQFTVTYRVSHLLSLNDKTQKMSNEQYLLPSPTACLMSSATSFCLALPCEQNRWLLRPGKYLQHVVRYQLRQMMCDVYTGFQFHASPRALPSEVLII